MAIHAANLGDKGVNARGTRSDLPKVPMVASGLVLGLGGTGIQVVSRVRSMVEAKMPEALLESTLSFLGVDSVSEDNQNPPLPEGVHLLGDEFFNLTETAFDPAKVLALESGYDSAVTQWWDYRCEAPSGALVDGCKQDRMVGRLSYYRSGQALAQRIQSALQQTADVNRHLIEKGLAGQVRGGNRPRVYLVASTCGGTGSAGVLEVLHAIWVAANQIGLAPEIRTFLLMPGFFEREVSRTSQDPVTEISQLRSNAYAFLRELDHFVEHGDQLGKQLANPETVGEATIPAADLVKQVYLIDNQMNSGQFLSKIKDCYEVLASAIHQMLLTDVGAMQTVNNTNVDQMLMTSDRYGKRRLYCGLGVTQVTYPGETLRRYLSHRFADWMIQQRLLAAPTDLSEQARRHPVRERLLTALGSLHGDAIQFQVGQEVSSFRAATQRAPEKLIAQHTPEAVVSVVTTIRNLRSAAIEQYKTQLTTMGKSAVEKIESTLIDLLLETGGSVPFMAEVLRHVRAQVKVLEEQSAGQVRQHQGTVARSEDEIPEAERALNSVGLVRGWLGHSRTKAKELGDVLARYGLSSLEEHKMVASQGFYQQALANLDKLMRQLDRSAAHLNALSQSYGEIWRSDELVGKDAGPENLCSLIPSDVLPQVEDSSLARESFARLIDEFGRIDAAALLRDFYCAWRGEQGGNKAVFSYGSAANDVQQRAFEGLQRELTSLADIQAMQVRVPDEDADGESNEAKIYLPRSLPAAAARVDDGATLDLAFNSFADLTSRVLLSVDLNKLGLGGELAPAAAIARHPSAAAILGRFVKETTGRMVTDWPDEERVQSLTTMWGAAAHAVTAVATWRKDYLAALERLAGAAAGARSPHLSAKWATELEPLEPSYLDLPAAAETFVEAGLASQLLADELVASAIFGSNALPHVKGLPWEMVDLGTVRAWRARKFVKNQTTARWEAQGPGTDYLGDLGQVLEAVAKDAGFRVNADEFCAAVFQVAGTTQVLAKAREYDLRLASLVQEESTPEANKPALLLMQRELRELIGGIEFQINSSGL